MLAWNDNSTNETGFRIERSNNGTSGWSLVTTVGANVTSYENTGLRKKTTYYYRVRANGAAGDSAWSNVANGRTLNSATASQSVFSGGSVRVGSTAANLDEVISFVFRTDSDDSADDGLLA